MLAKPESALSWKRPLLTVIGASLLAACGTDDSAPVAVVDQVAAEYIGGRACAACHQEQTQSWQGSDHDLAMRQATEQTVLGNFANAQFSYGPVDTAFFRRDGGYFVRTDGIDGDLREFEIFATFGVDPLQQYLIELDDGKVQALSIAWDSRPEAEGGERWFHLYPDEELESDDPLHWTGVYQRWNTMCADCHSTGLTKNYQPENDSFDTRWLAEDVDCEACHGPGSLHAAAPADIAVVLPASEHGWAFLDDEPIATRQPAANSAAEIEVCARCHSLRTQLTDEFRPGEPFLDGFRPELLREDSYHADGQVQGEVYVYGSFLQSAMAAAGVTCSDCHDPHSADLRIEGNGVCAQCHRADVYDSTAHHRHQVGTDAGQCVSCHMRAETFMVVDDRRDHSFRVPRPDLTVALGSPNACNDCHDTESATWSAGAIAGWFPQGQWNDDHYGEAIQAGRSFSADARARLLAVITDRAVPGIVRATALELLPGWLTDFDSTLLEPVLEDEDALVRLAAIEATASLSPEIRVQLVQRFLTDDLLAVRTAAARVLLSAREAMSGRRQSDLDLAIEEFLDVQRFNSDRAQGLLSRAIVALDRGQTAEAEALLTTAIERHPSDTALHVNLAELYRIQDRLTEAEAILRRGLERTPEDPALALALGYVFVVDERASEALPFFEQAAARGPDQPIYAYVLAIAQNDLGNPERAREILEQVVERFPGHTDSLLALATMSRDAGRRDAAIEYAERLNSVHPGHPVALSLLMELGQQL